MDDSWTGSELIATEVTVTLLTDDASLALALATLQLTRGHPYRRRRLGPMAGWHQCPSCSSGSNAMNSTQESSIDNRPNPIIDSLPLPSAVHCPSGARWTPSLSDAYLCQ